MQLTPHDRSQLATATARRKADVESAPIRDAMRKAKAAEPKLAALIHPLAAGTRVPLATSRALSLKLDFTGDGKFGGADAPKLQDAVFSLTQWNQETPPATGLQAAVSGTTVNLSWTNQADPLNLDGIQIWRNSQVIATIPPTNNGYADNSVPAGTHTYQVQAMSPGFEGELSAGVQATVGTVIPPAQGWTEFLDAEAEWFVSSSGNDAGAGTQASPFRTLAKAYSMVRDGHRDWIRPQCGGTWNESVSWSKGAGATGYCGIRAYGVGARPKLRTSGTAIDGGRQSKRGVAIVGLDMKPNATMSSGSGVQFFCPWSDILVEDCLIVGYPCNTCFQEVQDGERAHGLVINRNVVADSVAGGGGHSQGCFQGSNDNWRATDNFIIRNGVDGTMFSHGRYTHETNGPGVETGNTFIANGSHGTQQRPGGKHVNNLFLGNSVNGYIGSQGNVNTILGNVCIDAKNIGPNDGRGMAFTVAGAAGSKFNGNIATDQIHGTDAIAAFTFDGWFGSEINDNVCDDWCGPNANPQNPGWACAFEYDSGGGNCQVLRNRVAQRHNGMVHRFEGRSPAGMTFGGGTYFTTTPDAGANGYMPCSTGAGQGKTRQQWTATSGDTSTWLAVAPPVVRAGVAEYLTEHGIAPGSDPLATYEAGCRAQSRQTWNPIYTAAEFNKWKRIKHGVAEQIVSV